MIHLRKIKSILSTEDDVKRLTHSVQEIRFERDQKNLFHMSKKCFIGRR